MSAKVLMAEARRHADAAVAQENPDGDTLKAADHYVRAVELLLHVSNGIRYSSQESAQFVLGQLRAKIDLYLERAQLLNVVGNDEPVEHVEVAKPAVKENPKPSQQARSAEEVAQEFNDDDLPIQVVQSDDDGDGEDCEASPHTEAVVADAIVAAEEDERAAQQDAEAQAAAAEVEAEAAAASEGHDSWDDQQAAAQLYAALDQVPGEDSGADAAAYDSLGGGEAADDQFDSLLSKLASAPSTTGHNHDGGL
jgi:hypothetical protein